MKIEQIQMLIAGNVQGVGFRYATQAEARKLGLKGWVRNTSESRVEIVAQGEAAGLDNLVQWCGIGPAHARVDRIEIVSRGAISTLTFPDFDIES